MVRLYLIEAEFKLTAKLCKNIDFTSVLQQ